MLRVELWHPMMVHFPIGLLIVGAALRFASLAAPPFFGRRWRSFVLDSAKLVTVIGTLFAWTAWYTGGLAEEEVNSNLCDPTLTHLHGDYAFYVTIAFSVVALSDVASIWLRLRPAETRLRFLNTLIGIWAIAVVSWVAAGFLAYVGHLGAGLTYNQAAGVYVPSPQCTEFAE